MPRVRRRGLSLSFGALLLFVVGTNVQAGWLFALASLLIGAVLVGLLVPGAMTRRVRVERDAPSEAFVGDEVRVDLRVRAYGPGVRASLVIRDDHIAPVSAFLPLLRPKEGVVISTRRRASRRGGLEAPPIVVSSAAPFGVAESRRKVEAPGRTIVYPRVVPLEGLPWLHGLGISGESASSLARRGTGHDFLGIREYRSGDSLRHVHWPSTAHHGALMVREFEQEQPLRMVIAVDGSADLAPTGPGGTEEETALDLCCSAAASVALWAERAGYEVDILMAERDGVRLLESVDRTEALTFLADLRPDGQTGMPGSLTGLAEGVRSGFGGAGAADRMGRADIGGVTALFLAFPTWRANAWPELGPALAGWAGSGAAVAAAIVDTAALVAKPGSPGGGLPGSLSLPLLRGGLSFPPRLDPAQVESLVSGLRGIGATVVLIDPLEDMRTCFEHPLSPVA